MAVIIQHGTTIVLTVFFTTFLLLFYYVKVPKVNVKKTTENDDLLAAPNLTDLERKYCRNTSNAPPLSGDHVNFDMERCSSVRILFTLLMNDCRHESLYKLRSVRLKKIKFGRFERKLIDSVTGRNVSCNESGKLVDGFDKELANIKRRNDEEREEGNDNLEEEEDLEPERDSDTTLVDDEAETVIEKLNGSKTNIMSLVYIAVCLLLLISMGFSLVEFWRERKRKKLASEMQDATSSEIHTYGRRMSIVDLTVNRHARKESQQRDSITSCGSGYNHTGRRSSFPAQVPEFIRNRTRFMPKRQQTWSPPGTMASARRMSIDINDDDSSPDRRRVRIIRRH